MRAIVIVGGWLVLLACPAFAGGLDLTWDACAIDGGVSDVVLDCGSSDPYRAIYATFITDTDVPAFRWLSFVADFEVDAPTLPDFWLFFATGGQIGTPWCNLIDHVAAQCPHAPSVLSGSVGGIPEENSEYIPYIGGVPNRGRLVGQVYRGEALPPLTLRAGQIYLAFAIRIYMGLATEAGGPCDGCTTPATIVLNQITLYSAEVPPVVLTGPGMLSNCVTTSGGGSVPCGATPAKRSTWGSIKALYR